MRSTNCSINLHSRTIPSLLLGKFFLGILQALLSAVFCIFRLSCQYSLFVIISVSPNLTRSEAYWQNPSLPGHGDIRLMVKHVFITSDFGEDNLPRWAGWVKVVVDAEDLPLNVSRETLQSTRFLKQIKHVILKHLIQLFNKLATEDPEKFYELRESYNNVFKVGAVEDGKNRNKLAALARFETNQRGNVTLDAVRWTLECQAKY
jgi:Hsp90 protein